MSSIAAMLPPSGSIWPPAPLSGLSRPLVPWVKFRFLPRPRRTLRPSSNHNLPHLHTGGDAWYALHVYKSDMR